MSEEKERWKRMRGMNKTGQPFFRPLKAFFKKSILLARRSYKPLRRPIDSALLYDSGEMLGKLKRVVIVIIMQWVKKAADIGEFLN